MTDRVVVAVVPDLMDRSRLRASGTEVRHVTAGRLAQAVAAGDVDLVVVDLSRRGALDAIASLPEGGPKVIGFGPHVEADLLEAAMEVGCTEVLPRSKFFTRWPAV